MKKTSFIILVFLLVLQSYIAPLAVSANSNGEGGYNETAEATAEEQTVTDGIEENPAEVTDGSSLESEETEAELPGNSTEDSVEEPLETPSGQIIEESPEEASEGPPAEESSEQTSAESTEFEDPQPEELESNVFNEEEGTTDLDGCGEHLEGDGQIDCEPVINELQLEPTEIKGNILTGVVLSYEDRNGNPVDAPDMDSIISVHYEWKLENGHGYKAGATFIFKLPDELTVHNAVQNSEMEDPSGEIVGHFTVGLDGQATVTFTDYIERLSNINGTLEVLTKLTEETIITSEKVITITPIEGGASIEIPIAYTPKGKTIDKQGKPNRSYNAEEIEWTVDFNKSLEHIENAVLSDPIQEGQELVANSIKLYHLDVKLNGEVILGEKVNSGYSVGKATDDKEFVINFNGDIDSAYHLVYTTKVTDDDQQVFENTATLLSDNSIVGEASATVSVGRGTPLAKRSAHYDQETQTITWEIKYNYNEKKIAKEDAVLVDVFTGSQELIDGSFKVEKIEIDQEGTEGKDPVIVSGSEYEVIKNDEKNGFTFQFNQDIDSAYKITYQTKAKDRVFKSETIANTVTTGDYKTEGKQDINQQILFKTNYNANYKEKNVDWEIRFNQDSHEMKNVVLTDVFTNAGLTLIDETIEITADGKTIHEGEDKDYTITINEDENQFVIRFRNVIEKPHTIKFTTKFDYEQRTNKAFHYLANKVTLEWKEQDQPKKIDTTSNFHPDRFTQSNGFKNGSYNAEDQVITWNIGVNYNLITLPEAIVEDYIQGNQQLIKESLKVYEMALTGEPNGTDVGEELILDQDYSIEWMKDEDESFVGFRVEFINEIKFPYVISYKTSLKGLAFVESEYENTATLYDGSEKQTELSATVPIKHGGAYTEKSGLQDGKVINWSVNINFAQAEVSNAKISDEPDANQRVLKDSIHLYATTVDIDGSVKKEGKLTDGEDYQLIFYETHDPLAFELTFKNQISEPYILEYQSYILEAPASIANKVSFTGDHVRTDWIVSSETVEARRTSGSGTGEGVLGGLIITKTDAATGAVLEGAEFILIDEEYDVVMRTGTTDANGVLAFEGLLFGKYRLVETKAPEGYLKNTAEVPVTIDKAYVSGDPERSGNEQAVPNQKLIHAVQLKKVDQADPNRVLADAQFKLQDKNGTVVVGYENLLTDEDGVIIINNLEPDDYQLVETKAPSGYVLDSTPIKFVIEKDQIELVELVKSNKRRSGGGSSSRPNKPVEDEEHDPNDPGEQEEPNDPSEPGEKDPSNPTDPGQQEEPKDPINPEKPTDPSQPETPSNPDNVGDQDNNGDPVTSEQPRQPSDPDGKNPVENSKISKVNGGKVLPQTGEAYPLGTLLTGIAAILVGLFLLFSRRKIS